jgi:hypothetical protein
MYVLVNGFGERISKRVARGLLMSRTRPAKIVRLREGTSGVCPSDVTMQTGASKPGFRRFNESLVEEMNGLTTS